MRFGSVRRRHVATPVGGGDPHTRAPSAFAPLVSPWRAPGDPFHDTTVLPAPRSAAPYGARDRDRSLRYARPGRTAATVLVVGLLLLGAAAAEAQTSRVLVTNAFQSGDDSANTSGNDHGQLFHTGANTAGYTFTSVIVNSDDTEGDDFDVEICEADTTANEFPTSTCTALTAPDSFTAGGGNVIFTHTGLALSANTNYVVVIKQIGTGSVEIDSTTSNGEDSNGLSDWSIKNKFYWKSGSTWMIKSGSDEALSLVVSGYANTVADATDATLSALSVSGATLSPAFAAATTTYHAVVANSVSQATITQTTSETTATVEYLDSSDATLTDADTMTADFQRNLSVGTNPVKVKVTAPDTTTTETYTVNVFRVAVPVACSPASMTNRIWTGNLTVGTQQGATAVGYGGSFGSLDNTTFSYNSNAYSIDVLNVDGTFGILVFSLGTATLGTDANDLILHIGTEPFALADADSYTSGTNSYSFHTNAPTWADGDAVCLALTADGPAVSSVALTSAPGADNTYAIGDDVQATVTFSAAVDISGNPQLELDFDGTTKAAACATGTNTTTMVCEYEVAVNDAAPDGVAIAANTLTGGTITATGSTTLTADLTHSAVAIDASHKVDGIRPTLVTTGTDAPTTSTDGTQVILTFSEDISAVSLSDIDVTANSTSGYEQGATVSRSGRTVTLTLLSPSLVIQTGWAVTVALSADAVDDAAGNGILAVAATTVTNAVGTTTAPTVTGIALTSTPGADNTYAIGDAVEATVTFSEAVDITGSPQLELDFAGTAKGATCATGMNTTTMVCSYTVVADDSAPDGVAIAANTLTGGTITATGSTTAADLDHSAVAIDAGHTVDGIRPTLDLDGGTVLIFSIVALTFSEDLDQTSVPDTSQFTVTVKETVRTFTITVNSVTIDPDAVYVGFSTDPSPLRPGEHLSISYTKPASNPLQDASGNEVESFTDIEVYNNLTPTAPEAPGSLAAGPGDSVGAMDLTWETPWHNGDEITKFQVRHEAGPSVSASTTWEDIDGSGPTTTRHTVTGLTEGTEYTFEVRAVNGLQFGFGDGDVAATTVTYAVVATGGGGSGGGGGGSPRETAPDAPRNLTATAGDQTVQLAWSTPANDGGSPIVRYEYRQQDGDGPLGAWQILAGDPPPTAYTVTGLTNGVSYTFEVRAVNRHEASPPSEAARATPEPARAALAVAIVGVPEVALTGASYELTAQSDAEEALGYAWRVAYGEGGSVEPTDTQTVVWTAPSGVTVAWIRVEVTREEDGATAGQSAYVRVEVPDQTRLTLRAAPAPAEGGAPVTVTATLDAPAPADGLTVTLTTGGTATRDTDYTLSSSTITIAAGETAGTATITVTDDAEADAGETIVLNAASTTPALTAAPLTLTIEDNDATPVPALPLLGQLLLALGLTGAGARRLSRRPRVPPAA